MICALCLGWLTPSPPTLSAIGSPLKRAPARPAAAKAGPTSGARAASPGSTRASARTSTSRFRAAAAVRVALENPPLLIASDMDRIRRPHQLDQHRPGDARVRARGPDRRRSLRERLKQAFRRSRAPSSRARRRQALTEETAARVRRPGAAAARARARSPSGRALRQPAGLLHVRRGRRACCRDNICSRGCWNAAGATRRSSRPMRGTLFGAMAQGRQGRLRQPSTGSTAACSTTTTRCR